MYISWWVYFVTDFDYVLQQYPTDGLAKTKVDIMNKSCHSCSSCWHRIWSQCVHLQNTVFSPLPHLSEAIKIVWISINLWNILISFFVKICYRYRKTCFDYFSLFKRKPRPWAKNDIAVAFRTFLVMRSIKSEAIKTVRISINCFGFHLILSKQSQGRAKLRHTSFIGNQSVKL